MRFTVTGYANAEINDNQDWYFQSYEAKDYDDSVHAIHNTMPRVFDPNRPSPYKEFQSRDVEAETGYAAIQRFLMWQAWGYSDRWLLHPDECYFLKQKCQGEDCELPRYKNCPNLPTKAEKGGEK
jgi:hypothetical protein